VAVVNVSDLTVIEANHRAVSHFSLSPGAPFLPQLSDRDRRILENLLDKVREQGRAPGVAIQPAPTDGLWSLRASMMNAESGPVFICQLTQMRDAGAPRKGVSAASFIDRLPEGFVVVDKDGYVRAANGAFLELVQIGSEAAATQRKLTRWLSSPGADANVVIALIRKHGDLRRFQTSIEGELGQSVPVEITAVGDQADEPAYFGLLIRDVSHVSGARPPATGDEGFTIADFDNRTLEAIVQMSTEVIERKAILRALELTGGNRTAAARHLGLSRQSLHAKLKKYGLDQK
jgi:transcriptional regulator PpsR